MRYYIKRLCTRLTIHSVNNARRLVKAVIGFTVLGIGIALLVLPGPAFVVIPVGLTILAGEFVWARRLMGRFHYGISEIIRRTRKKRIARMWKLR